jgi:hypothetical protein
MFERMMGSALVMIAIWAVAVGIQAMYVLSQIDMQQVVMR